MSFAKRPNPAPIHDLQTMLRTVLPELGLGRDGLYGEETKAAVQAFQRQKGLPDTGVTDLATWQALVVAYQCEVILQGPAQPLLIILQPNQVIKHNSNNLHLYMIQGMLKALSRLYANVPTLNITGNLDSQTGKVLTVLQKSAGLPETGELDKMTWMILAHLYRLAVGDGTGTFPCRRAQSNTAVEEIT